MPFESKYKRNLIIYKKNPLHKSGGYSLPWGKFCQENYLQHLPSFLQIKLQKQ